MNIKSECGDWELSDDDGLVISADSGQIGWELSPEQERQLAKYLCKKHKGKHLFDSMLEASIKYNEYLKNMADAQAVFNTGVLSLGGLNRVDDE